MTIHTLSDDQTPTILTVPGLMNSGPGHWQSLWEKALPDCHRVELGSWDAPHRNAWITNLGHAIAQVDGPVILAAHSLGCATRTRCGVLMGSVPRSPHAVASCGRRASPCPLPPYPLRRPP